MGDSHPLTPQNSLLHGTLPLKVTWYTDDDHNDSANYVDNGDDGEGEGDDDGDGDGGGGGGGGGGDDDDGDDDGEGDDDNEHGGGSGEDDITLHKTM